MSERPKWMPYVDTTLAIVLGSYNVFRTDREFHRTGLRARLAVLEELNEGQTGHMVDRAKKMIEEIRKELEG